MPGRTEFNNLGKPTEMLLGTLERGWLTRGRDQPAEVSRTPLWSFSKNVDMCRAAAQARNMAIDIRTVEEWVREAQAQENLARETFAKTSAMVQDLQNQQSETLRQISRIREIINRNPGPGAPNASTELLRGARQELAQHQAKLPRISEQLSSLQRAANQERQEVLDLVQRRQAVQNQLNELRQGAQSLTQSRSWLQALKDTGRSVVNGVARAAQRTIDYVIKKGSEGFNAGLNVLEFQGS